jgi:hypothetical protein
MIKEKLIIKWSSNDCLKGPFLSLPWILKCPYLPNFSEKIIV